MRHASLFSGIGGFDLAADWMGWENKFHCEWNPFGQKVLKYYWPEAESFDDITKTDFTKYANTIDILTGGFPCQPYSLAGKRKGKDDDRHLWPEMLRAIREIKPRWVIGENVLGLVNWNGGLVFHEVQSDLEAQGYEVFPYVLPAASVNAPHRRDRVWFVAYSNKQRNTSCGKGESIEGKWCGNNGQSEKWSEQTERFDGLDGFQQSFADSDNNGLNECNGTNEIISSERGVNALGNISESNGNGTFTNSDFTRCENRHKQHWWESTSCREGKHCTCGYCIGFDGDATDTNVPRCGQSNKKDARKSSKQFNGNSIQSNAFDTISIGWDKIRDEGRNIINGKGKREFGTTNSSQNWWRNFPSVPPICTGDDGISDRLDSITFSKWRKQSIMAGGNAVVPQLIYVLFKTISKFEELKTKQC